jgi:hypothetical protein
MGLQHQTFSFVLAHLRMFKQGLNALAGMHVFF